MTSMAKLPILFKLLPDETVFSVISRYYAVSGYINQKYTVQSVFNKTKKRIHPYLPSQIDCFAEYFDITASQVLTNFTLFPLFSKFLPPEQATKLMKVMCFGKSCPTLTSLLPLYNSKFFAGHKYCPVCVKSDISIYGTPYWHTAHQIPGISVCPIHNCYLNGISNDDYHLDRKLCLPPSNAKVTTSSKLDSLLSEYSFKVLTNAKLNPLTMAGASTYREKLVLLQLLSQGGNLKYESICQSLAGFWKGVSTETELSFPSKLLSFEFIGPLLRNKTGTAAHPIKHLLFSCWLEHVMSQEIPSAIAPKKVASKKEINTKILHLFKSGNSMNKIEHELAVSRCYIRKVLEINGIEHGTNSMRLSKNIERQIIIKGLYGYSINQIATALSVKPCTVEHIICRTQNLTLWRKHLRHQNKIEAAVNTIKDVRKDNPKWIRKDIKANCNSAFFLLYYHDKTLLESLLPDKTRPIPPNCKK